MHAFIICGYGIPKDIFHDENYTTYLNIVFNTMFSEAHHAPALIIPSGGPTSCHAPYTGTEAEEMMRYLTSLIERPCMNGAGLSWKMLPDKASLSSLENMLRARDVLAHEADIDEIVLFCEATRTQRNERIAREVFGALPVRVVGIDFDISQNRYALEHIKTKEELETAHALWALQSPEHLAQHHAFFEQRLHRLRELDAQGVAHADAVARVNSESIATYQAMR